MAHFPQEILHNILYRTPLDVQSECTLVCHSWRAAARHVLGHTGRKIVLRTDHLLHYANQLNDIPGYGQGASSLTFSVRTYRDANTAAFFERVLVGWPQVVRLQFTGAYPGDFVDVLRQENVPLPDLQEIRVSRAQVASLGHTYLELLNQYSGSLRRAMVDIRAANLADPFLNIYGEVVQYCERFPHLTHLVLRTDRQLVLLDLLSHCPGLRSLELDINPDRFLLSQEVYLPPPLALQHFKADAGLFSLGLHFYLRDLCPLTDLAVSFADGSSLSSMVNTFETYVDADSLRIQSFVFADNFPVPPQMLSRLAAWFPALNSVEFNLCNFSGIMDLRGNVRLAFAQLRIAYLSIDISAILARRPVVDKMAVEFAVGGVTAWLQRDGAWRSGRQFTIRGNRRYLASSAQRYRSLDTTVLQIEAASLATIRFITSVHNSLFEQTIHINFARRLQC
ncbi:hypothetical protein MBANPS3_010097 [Mucor bainieri]